MPLPDKCPKCQGPWADVRMIGEDAAVLLSSHEIIETQRVFKGTCSTCGRSRQHKVGHHSTLGKKQNQRRFPDKISKRLEEYLPANERQLFNDFRQGWALPPQQKVDSWERLIFTFYIHLLPI